MNKDLVKEQLTTINNLIESKDKIECEIRRTLFTLVEELQGDKGGVILYKSREDMIEAPLKFHDESIDEESYIYALRVSDGQLQAVVDTNWYAAEMPRYIDEIDNDLWFNIFTYGKIDVYGIYDALMPLICEDYL
jgi:hypothetical protein